MYTTSPPDWRPLRNPSMCTTMQAAGDDLQAALGDKDEAFESVTALLDDTLEQADIALDEAKRALQQGPTSAPNQARISYCSTNLTR